MLHICVFDNVHYSDLKDIYSDSKKEYGLLISVNAHVDLSNRTDLHRKVRFNEFCCFIEDYPALKMRDIPTHSRL